MAYTTELQQVIHHLRQGGKLKPHAGPHSKGVGTPAQPTSPLGKPHQKGAKGVGGLPLGPPPKQGK